MCYPNPARPTQGIFIQRRLQAIHQTMPVRVAAPVPWFPFVRPFGFDAYADRSAAPPVVWPKMFYLPGLMKRWDAGFYAAALRSVMPGILESGPVDVVDAHFEWPDAVGAWRVARERGLPLVCTIRGKLVSQATDSFKRRAIVEMLCGADALIAVSQSLADLANELAGKDLGVRVIPNGIDRDDFHRTGPSDQTTRPDAEVRAALGWCEDARYAVCVGHIQALKGFDTLVAAWTDVRRRAGEVRLVLVGGEANEPAFSRHLRKQIETVNARSPAAAVVLMNRCAPSRVAELLNAADVFVLASRSEGWCNALAEARACGCPVVATDVGGNREIVSDEGLGQLAKPGDRGAFVDAVCESLDRRWDRNQIAEVGGRRDWQQVARECVDVFENVIATRR